jgi:hypothetical protein
VLWLAPECSVRRPLRRRVYGAASRRISYVTRSAVELARGVFLNVIQR